MLKHLVAASVVIALAACADVHVRMQDPKPDCGTDRPFAEGGERATLWIRGSAEFRSSAEGIYRSALLGLQKGLADSHWSAEPTQTRDFSGLPPAVVMDIDETVLDNSAPQAEMMLKGTCPGEFEALWDAWLAERTAPAVPGAATFIRAARESKDAEGRPVRVFLITNRECKARAGSRAACPQQDDTVANLRALGLDSPTLEEDLMMKGELPEWVGEKLTRRQYVARDYRIVLNVGDDLADFIPDVRSKPPVEREKARCIHRDWWGARWFVIPNPIYGSWQRALGNDLAAALEQPPPPDCDGTSFAP
jgi:acid phosphatase